MGSSEFLETLKTDLLEDRVFVYTPEGDILDLPEGSSALDFAYIIHSDIGNHAIGANINNKYAALRTTLKNRDVVEILTKDFCQ